MHDERNQSSKEKKQYRPPQVIVYGSLTAITAAIGVTSAKPDGAGGQINKTS